MPATAPSIAASSTPAAGVDHAAPGAERRAAPRYHFRVPVQLTGSGLCEVYFDDLELPVIRTFDKTFGKGRIGFGSFDDTGQFDVVRLYARS